MNKSSIHFLKSIFLLAIAIGLTGCETTVGINARMPAKYPEAAELRRVAVAGFDGTGGNGFTEAFVSELVTAKFDGAPFFTVLGKSGTASNAEAAVRFGRSVGADGVYFGRVLTSDWNDESSEGTSSRCSQTDDDGKCTKYTTVKVYCTKRTMQMSVLPMLVQVSDGKVVYSSQQAGAADTNWCAGQAPSLSNDQLYAKARSQIFENIRKDIAPYNTVMRAALKKDAGGLPPNESEKFNLAAKAAATGDMITACRLWSEINQAAANHAGTIYDLGICAEASAKYSDALALYRSAQGLVAKTDNDIQASITRANNLLQAENQLVAQQQERERKIAQAQKERQEQEATARAEQAKREAEEQRRRVATEQAAKKELAAKKSQYVSAYGEEIANAILANRVVIGMPAEAVILVRGNPDRKDKVGPSEELWHYGKAQIAVVGGRVTYVGQ